MGDRKSEFIEKLKATGEAGVREKLTLKHYGGDHVGWAALWLGSLEQARADADAASHRKLVRSQAAAARSQAKAARESAKSARVQATEATEANRLAREANTKADTANTIATLAMIGAAIAIAVTIIGLFLR